MAALGMPCLHRQWLYHQLKRCFRPDTVTDNSQCTVATSLHRICLCCCADAQAAGTVFGDPALSMLLQHMHGHSLLTQYCVTPAAQNNLHLMAGI